MPPGSPVAHSATVSAGCDDESLQKKGEKENYKHYIAAFTDVIDGVVGGCCVGIDTFSHIT